MGKWREGGKIKREGGKKKREVEAEEKEGLQHKLIDMQSGCSSIRVHTLAKARTTDTRRLNLKSFAAQIQIPLQSKYLGVGYKGFCRNIG